ncbi:HAD family hydrolase [Planosporangium sp. 12N6]|uniref:HAD family hydrolase n=1 Tax=Planosporangium spinosum TaxID=3402278 RepID=UPI003CF0D636
MHLGSAPPRAVVFDFFGTLTTAVRRGPRHAVIARRLGCDPEAFAAELDRTFYLRAAGRYGDPVDGLRRVAYAAGGRPTLAELRDAVAARVAAVRADTTLRPDAVGVLARLRRRGVPAVLVSDCWYELPAFLPRLPVAPLLEGCVYSVRVGHCKPHPATYLEACRQLRLDPDECLYVGDGGSRELSGARDVGMTAVRLAAPDLAGHLVFRGDPDWRGPAVGSLTEVLELVERVPDG